MKKIEWCIFSSWKFQLEMQNHLQRRLKCLQHLPTFSSPKYCWNYFVNHTFIPQKTRLILTHSVICIGPYWNILLHLYFSIVAWIAFFPFVMTAIFSFWHPYDKRVKASRLSKTSHLGHNLATRCFFVHSSSVTSLSCLHEVINSSFRNLIWLTIKFNRISLYTYNQ